MCADDPHKDDPGVPVFPNLADALLALAARWAADLKSRSDDRSEKIVEAVGRLLVDQHVVCGAGCYRNCQDGTWALMTSAGGKPGGPGFPVKLHVQAGFDEFAKIRQWEGEKHRVPSHGDYGEFFEKYPCVCWIPLSVTLGSETRDCPTEVPFGLLLVREKETPFGAEDKSHLKACKLLLQQLVHVGTDIDQIHGLVDLVPRVAGVLAKFAWAPNELVFERILCTLLTSDKGFRFDRALCFLMDLQGTSATCDVGLGGNYPEWGKLREERIDGVLAKMSLATQIDDSLDHPDPKTGCCGIADPLFDDLRRNPLHYHSGMSSLIDRLIADDRTLPAAIPLGDEDPWIREVRKNRRGIFLHTTREHFVLPLRPPGTKEPVGFVVTDFSYRREPHKPTIEFANLSAVAQVLEIIADIWLDWRNRRRVPPQPPPPQPAPLQPRVSQLASVVMSICCERKDRGDCQVRCSCYVAAGSTVVTIPHRELATIVNHLFEDALSFREFMENGYVVEPLHVEIRIEPLSTSADNPEPQVRIEFAFPDLDFPAMDLARWQAQRASSPRPLGWSAASQLAARYGGFVTAPTCPPFTATVVLPRDDGGDSEGGSDVVQLR